MGLEVRLLRLGRSEGATFLSKQGISEQIVQKLGGWKRHSILCKIYEHVG